MNSQEIQAARKIVVACAELTVTIDSRPPTLEGRNLRYAVDQLMDALDAWRMPVEGGVEDGPSG